MTLRTLKVQACKAASARGHVLGRFVRDIYEESTWLARCTRCKRHVTVHTRPPAYAPTGMDGGGISEPCPEVAP